MRITLLQTSSGTSHPHTLVDICHLERIFCEKNNKLENKKKDTPTIWYCTTTFYGFCLRFHTTGYHHGQSFRASRKQDKVESSDSKSDITWRTNRKLFENRACHLPRGPIKFIFVYFVPRNHPPICDYHLSLAGRTHTVLGPRSCPR